MYGVQIAFKDFVASKGFSGSPWATPLLKHFYTFFSSVNFWGILGNTLKLSLYYIAASFPAAVILALMINEVKMCISKSGTEYNLSAVLRFHCCAGGHDQSVLFL